MLFDVQFQPSTILYLTWALQVNGLLLAADSFARIGFQKWDAKDLLVYLQAAPQFMFLLAGFWLFATPLNGSRYGLTEQALIHIAAWNAKVACDWFYTGIRYFRERRKEAEPQGFDFSQEITQLTRIQKRYGGKDAAR